MCGTWIALQDIVANSGELVVYPGSHRERRVYLAETGCAKVGSEWQEFGKKVVPLWVEIEKRYEKFIYRPKKGTVLIWHENLLHGGSVRIDPSLQRRSMVIHSFADGAIGYYDSTGMSASAVNVNAIR
jgi:ectoine hydroxylase-related dioxygenase (phytanoyl-CoA dioxygenase family)